LYVSSDAETQLLQFTFSTFPHLRYDGSGIDGGHFRYWDEWLHDMREDNFRAELLRERHRVGERLLRAVGKIDRHENAFQSEECFYWELRLVRTEFDEHTAAFLCRSNFHIHLWLSLDEEQHFSGLVPVCALRFM